MVSRSVNGCPIFLSDLFIEGVDQAGEFSWILNHADIVFHNPYRLIAGIDSVLKDGQWLRAMPIAPRDRQ